MIHPAASDSPFAPLLPQRASISSMKIIDGEDSCARAKSCDTTALVRLTHVLTKSTDEMEKNVEPDLVAAASARELLPVPGGPYNRIRFCGLRLTGLGTFAKVSLSPAHL